MKQMIPLCPSPYRLTRPAAIPSFHLDICPLLPERVPVEFDATAPMSSVKYILATKSSFLSSSWRGGGGLLAIRFVRMAADGVVAEGGYHFTGLLPRSSFLVMLLPSFSFVVALYENEKATSYQIESPSANLFSALDRYAPSYGSLFLVCSTSMSYSALSPRRISALS